MSPSRGSSIDTEALSGICGSISIACWVVVFSPQIIENFRRSSAEGLSLSFIIIWLLGDIFNILGAILQGVLPTMIILAVYYTVADLVLLGQCFYYKGCTLKDESAVEDAMDPDDGMHQEGTERTALLASSTLTSPSPQRPRISDADRGKRGSFASSVHSYISSASASKVDATHLSPATPFIPPKNPTATPPAAETLKPTSSLKTFTYNTGALVLVCGIGVLGWWLSARSIHIGYPRGDEEDGVIAIASEEELRFDLWGQIFGYLCAVLYLGSRIPQILLNQRRKSTEGVSMLFFLFACVGNATYVMSIFAYEPACAGLAGLNGQKGGTFGRGVGHNFFSSEEGGCRPHEWNEQYGKYIAVNASWIVGSAGTLILDLIIFGQFWIYRDKAPQAIE